MSNINKTLSKLLEYRQRSLDLYKFTLPNLYKIRTRGPSKFKLLKLEIILRICIFHHYFSISRKLPRYIFSSMRFPLLMSTMQPKEVMVMGGVKEFIFCLKNGYRFYWMGPIYYGFNLFIFSGKNNLFDSVITILRKIFSKDTNKRYLFLLNDQHPAEMTLSFALEDSPKLNIVCISHGMLSFETTGQKDANDGESCKFNFVWSDSQKSFFTTERNYASFTLGLPYEVYQAQSQCKEVILVGHCGVSSDILNYCHSVYHFISIYQALEKVGIKVFYRPHPQDDFDLAQEVFSNISVMDKNVLLASARRVYIGFESTLVFEAREFGNISIGLDSLEIQDARAFDVDFEVSSDNFESLPGLILDIFHKNESKKNDKYGNLKTRFDRCINQIDEFNATYKFDERN